jgi:hypothetical protein
MDEDLYIAVILGKALLHFIQRFIALDRIGGVNVEEYSLAARMANVFGDPFDNRHGRLTVQVNTENVQAFLRELDGSGTAESARTTKD